MIEFISQPWPWYIAGPGIAIAAFFLFYFGRHFGVSSNFETLCSMAGAGKYVDYFKFDWKKNSWNLFFLVGATLGGFIAVYWLMPESSVGINQQTIQDLADIGIQNAGASYMPAEIFSMETMLSFKGFIVLLVAGAMVGFGARWAGGCTSGHAVAGLSNLELPSLITVIGFFIGGLLMTWILLPLIL